MASVQCTKPVEATAFLKDNKNDDLHHDEAKTGHETAKADCDGKTSNGQHHVEPNSSLSSSHGSTTTCHGKTEKKTKDKKEKKEKKDKKRQDNEQKEKKDKKCHEKEYKKEKTHKKKCKDGKSGHSSSDSSGSE